MPQNGVHLDGAAVRSLRDRLFLTQDELADKAGIHPNTLARIESDPTYRAGFKTLRAIAQELACTPSDLVLINKEGAA